MISTLLVIVGCKDIGTEERDLIVEHIYSLENKIDALEGKLGVLINKEVLQTESNTKLHEEIANLCIVLKSVLVMDQYKKEAIEK
jgi:hypothetical protein